MALHSALIFSPEELRFLAACRDGALSSAIGTPEHPVTMRRVRIFWRKGLVEAHPHADGGRSWNTLRYTLTEEGRQVLAKHHL
jgi:hypothetical protein